MSTMTGRGRTGHKDHLDRFAQVPLFSGLSKKDLEVVARASVQVTVEPGRVLTRQGETGHEFFLISDGSCDVQRDDKTVATLSAGQWFGEMAVLAKSPRNATVVAAEPTTLLVLGQREFLGVLDQVPTIGAKMLRTLAARVRDQESDTVTH